MTGYTITGLENGVATGVFVRSFTGNGYSERAPSSSRWVRTKGDHTTPGQIVEEEPVPQQVTPPDQQPSHGTQQSASHTLGFGKIQQWVQETDTSTNHSGRAGHVTLTVQINPPLSRTSSVKVTMVGSATHTVDYFVAGLTSVKAKANGDSEDSGVLALPSLVSEATFEVWFMVDRIMEGNENIILDFSAIPNAPYTPSTSSQQAPYDSTEVLIVDDSITPPEAGECTVSSTPIGAPTPTVGTGAGVPESLEVLPMGNDTLEVRWTAGFTRSAKWNAYEVQYRLNGTAWPTHKGIGNAERGTRYFGRGTHGGLYITSIGSLTAGARYDVRVSNAKEEEYDRTVCTYEGDFTYKKTRVVEVSDQAKTKSSVLIPSGAQAGEGDTGALREPEGQPPQSQPQLQQQSPAESGPPTPGQREPYNIRITPGDGTRCAGARSRACGPTRKTRRRAAARTAYRWRAG